MDIRNHNKKAWDRQVENQYRWTVPVGDDKIEEARQGIYKIVLTPNRFIPSPWLGHLKGKQVLCLASGGGQQGPLLAAVGAITTVFDNSPKQLAQDRFVAEKHGLSLKTVEGDMRDLSVFEDAAFDLIVHPVSNIFVPDILPVWQEAYRVLKDGGTLLSGFINPVRYIFDEEAYEKGILHLKFTIPYSDLDHIDSDQRVKQRIDRGEPLEFCHSVEEQIAGQIQAGFVIIGFYEDREKEEDNDPVSRFMATYMATRALKMKDFSGRTPS